MIGVVYFNSNEYFLDAEDRKTLDDLIIFIKNVNHQSLTVSGHTDSQDGLDSYWLSNIRAETVANYITKYVQIPALNRIWNASTKPAAIGLDSKSLSLNRRVEIYLPVEDVVPILSPSTVAKTPVKKSYKSISFNRNEYFLDAGDRKSILSTVKSMAKIGCTKVFLKGSSEKTKGSAGFNIATSRVKAVKKYMLTLLPKLKITSESSFVSSLRVVKIRCSGN
jgi:hypothetical protein